MTKRRWLRSTLLILLTAGLAACGSQSRAGETSADEDAPATEEVASAETAEARAADAEAATSERPAPEESGETASEKPRTDGDRTTGAARAPRSAKVPAQEEPAADEAAAEPEPAVEEEPAAEPEPEPTPTATIAAGTSMKATLGDEISTKTAKVGDRFTATVTSPVLEGRRVLVPEGATLTGEITGVQKKSGDQKAGVALAFRTITIEGDPYPISGSLTSITPKTEREMKDEGKKIGGGAAAGGLLGAIIGGDAKGAVIGAAAGAAAGTAVTLATREEHAVLPAGTALELQLDESLEVRM